MSKSRLEKFLYALYSLDSSDLPTPLSRIEELYKCWVTGEEVSTFKPLSRVEKYLMAILGVYDVDSLPNPLSRVEVLLYKLAIGDDNLDDVKSFLSEHEELLAEIIRNGGVGGNIDIEYVLYTLSTEFNTLYNTAEKPVKSAILKGSTLVNMVTLDTTKEYVLEQDGSSIKVARFKLIDGFENNIYTIILEMSNVNIVNPNGSWVVYISTTSEIDNIVDNTTIKSLIKNGRVSFTYSTKRQLKTKNYFNICLHTDSGVGSTITIKNVVVLKGDHTQEDIPYFEGMQSVKMPVLKATGKNLFDKNKATIGITLHSDTGYTTANNARYTTDFICVKHISNIVISHSLHVKNIWGYDKDKKPIVKITANGNTTTVKISIPDDVYYIRVPFATPNEDIITDDIVNSNNIQIEEGTVATSYEPFKSNILTVNDDVTLRGIGDVQDDLNLITGELTQRVGEIVLDGNILGGLYLNGQDNFISTNFKTPNVKNQPHYTELGQTYVVADKVISSIYGWDKKFESISIHPTIADTMYLTLESNKIGITSDMDKNEKTRLFKKYLSDNPITVQYQLATELVKTVDLSTVNQDGNDTKLSTFNDITYVTLSSEGLIPEAELEVATKNEEDLEDSIVYTVHTLSEEYNTLYNTAEKPVKSAILKGHTLVNLARNFIYQYGYKFDWGGLVENTQRCCYSVESAKGDTKYLIKNFNESTQVYMRYYSNSNNNKPLLEEGWINLPAIITTPANTAKFTVTLRISTENETYSSPDQANKNLVVEWQGDVENYDIPYFEGVQSVKMPVLTTTGKNLFYSALEYGDFNNSTGVPSGNSTIIIRVKEYNKILPNKTYHITIFNALATLSNFCVHEYDNDFNYIKSTSSNVFTTSVNAKYVKFRFRKASSASFTKEELVALSCMITEGSTIQTTYEPYKSNILTVNDPIELGGIGVLQDELKLLTGELIQRTEEIKIKGNENWVLTETTEKGCIFRSEGINILKSVTTNIMNDKYPYYSTASKYDGGYGVLSATTTGKIRIITPLNTTLEEFKTKLASDQPTFRFELAEPTIKTVDLSVVDQDGNDTKLKTFDDITHVTLSSEGLIPEAELEVAEKVTEVAASMLSISREQEIINTTTNEQSENVDSTMIATTEIYEGLL